MTARNFIFAVATGAVAVVIGEYLKREIFKSEA